MKRYNPKEIEPKWQKIWEETGIYKASETSKKPKSYVLEFFPYPSGAAMHVGHVRNYTISDAVARFRRMQGMNVLHPMGWDAFGLPAENYAIKTGISPQQAIAENTAKFKQQLTQMGLGFDWSREFASSDPDYYKWTQWFFLLLYKRDLAYRSESAQWWCDICKTVLANEQVVDGCCWRHEDTPVTKKMLPQWFFKITDYADRLVADLDKLDWSESIKAMQRNWIGRSVGAEVDFDCVDSEVKINVFTTRIDTIFGVTYLALAPEHPFVMELTTSDNIEKVTQYIDNTKKKSEVERMETNREKTGVFTGSYAINPATKEKIPIWIADYVLSGYGTGAVMGVPAHDERDYDFVKTHNLPMRHVIEGAEDEAAFYGGEGRVKNSGKFDGMSSAEAREAITKHLEKEGVAFEKVNYRVRDWLISRQRYWGAPIPMIHCRECGIVPVPEEDLPVKLPELESYEPAGDGRSPLARVEEWVNVPCPTCDAPALRETDTMDGFACSSWYFLRFTDPHNKKAPFSREQVDKWGPVDMYVGGAEHAVMHLLYARMWTKVMYDAGLVGFDEPFTALRNQGMILAPDGRKMSKSYGNVISPNDLIDAGYGADSIRLMELFIAPWDQRSNWSVEGMGGCFRFLQRVWTLTQEFLHHKEVKAPENSAELTVKLAAAQHKAVKKVTTDIHNLGLNTAVAAQMEWVNTLYKLKTELPFSAALDQWRESLSVLMRILAPFAPHMTEELWQELGFEGSVHVSEWPQWDEALIVEDTVTYVIQVNGKVRANILLPKDAPEAEVVDAALDDIKVAEFIGNTKPSRVIFVPNKLVNFVVK